LPVSPPSIDSLVILVSLVSYSHLFFHLFFYSLSTLSLFFFLLLVFFFFFLCFFHYFLKKHLNPALFIISYSILLLLSSLISLLSFLPHNTLYQSLLILSSYVITNHLFNLKLSIFNSLISATLILNTSTIFYTFFSLIEKNLTFMIDLTFLFN
jgi:hypothetical protein